jgi:para-aminobenzoate synthetase/4-amino-4-deoxychorismate lyase
VQFSGKKYTPPVECGLLAGTFRQYLLDTNQLKERIIKKEELKKADKIYLINSVRKWIGAELCEIQKILKE